MEFQISQAQYAERRRIRLEKLLNLRSQKTCATILEKSLIIPRETITAESISKPRCDISSNRNDKVKTRQIKNRESALLSRKRKIDEMIYLHDKVNALEEEVFRLKSRLRFYEGDAVDCPIVIVPCTESDCISIASESTESENVRNRQSYPYSGRNIYQSKSKLKMRNDGFIVSNSNGNQYQNKCLSSLEPAVFI